MIGATESGLKAAQKNIDVRSNNLANAGTIGFKKSGISFADIFPNDPSSSPKTAIGAGVTTAAVDKSMSQGSISSTGNVTDLAISGNGFFVLGDTKPAVAATVTPTPTPTPPVVSPVFNGTGLTMASAVPLNTQTKSVQLNINYGTTFKNGDFSNTAATVSGNVTKISGWEIHNEQVMLGQDGTPGTSLIGGFQTPIDTSQAFSSDTNSLNYGTKNGYSAGDDTNFDNINFNSDLASNQMNLKIDNFSIDENQYNDNAHGYIVHGPYVISDQYINIAPGSIVSFDWNAKGGQDAYDINAYLLKDDGTIPRLR